MRPTLIGMKPLAFRMVTLVVTSLLLFAGAIHGEEIKVMTSGGFAATFLEVIPEFERATGNKIVIAFGASMGGAPDSIPSRLQRGEPVDVVILAGSALELLIKEGKVVTGSRVDLVQSKIGMAVLKGAPKPDISTVDALKRTLLQANSIAYSASASGIYLSTELFPRLGIAEQLQDKSTRVESERVGSVVARGDAEIGFQQISELLPIPGIDYVGPLPSEAQKNYCVLDRPRSGRQRAGCGESAHRIPRVAVCRPRHKKKWLGAHDIPVKRRLTRWRFVRIPGACYWRGF